MTVAPNQLLWFALAASAAAIIGSLIVLPSGHGTAVAPLGGLLLAVLLTTAQRSWLHWLGIAMAVELLASVWLRGAGWLPAAGDGLGHAMGILATAWLTQRVCGMPLRIDLSRHVAFLAVFTILPGAALSASVDMLVSVAQGHPVSGLSWLTLGSGYALSGLIVAPLLLAARDAWAHGKSISVLRGLEAAAVAGILCVTLHVVFSHQRPLMYVTLPIMLWVALRFGSLGMTLALILFAGMARYYTAMGLGPYALYPATENVLLVQSFLVLISISGLLLAAVTAERTQAVDELRRARDALDAKVNERTAALRESEHRLRALIDAMPDQVRVKDTQGHYLMVNRAAQESFGVTEAEMTGRTVFDVRSPEVAALIDAEDRQIIAGQKPERFERKSYHSNAWREVITVPLRIDGKMRGIISISRDISERKQTEFALRESENRLRALLDAMPDEVRLKDKQGRYLMLNRAAQEEIGLPEKDIVGKTVFDLRTPALAARIDAEDKRALASPVPLRVVRESYVVPNEWREAILTPIRDASGEVIGLVSMSRDVTERKQAEMEALREREQRYRMLVEMASDIIYRTDHKGCFTYFNSDALLQRYGFSREQLIGKHYLDLVHPDYRAQTEAYYQRYFMSLASSCYHEFPIVTGDGRTVWVGQHVNTFIENRRIVYHQAVCRDVTERVMVQQALRDTNEKLRQLSVRQEELLEAERTRIAHDLHDGIGQSLNLARIKLESAITETGAGAGTSTQRLREITAIIDETNAAIRSLEFDLSPPVLRELGLTPALEWLAEDMQRAYGLRVGVSDDHEPKALNPLCRAIVFRTVRELLINVVRHAGVKTAHVDVQRSGDTIVITVSDEGNGFDAKTVAGGLGLVSVRERLGFLGGEAILDSTPGEGTVATLRIPLSLDNTSVPS